MAYEQMSKEEAMGTLYHGAPQQAPMPVASSSGPMAPPTSRAPSAGKSIGKKPPSAEAPDAMSLVETVGKANKAIQTETPAPKAPSAIGGLVDQIVENWKPLATGAAATYAASRLLRKSPTETLQTRVEPTFATPEETAVFKPVEQPPSPSKLAVEAEAKFGVPLSDVENHFGVKVTNIKDAEILSNNYKNSLPGAVSNAPAGIPSAVNPMNALTGVAQPPVVPPTATEVLAAGGTPTQVATQTAAQAIDAVPPPQGMKPQYKPKKGEIGPGGYNWFASQVGPEDAPARWMEQYGEKNVPYKQVQSEYAATRYPVKPNPEGAKTGGAYGKPEHIPEFIKGGASIGGLLNVAGNALGILGLGQEYKKAKKSGDWSDFGLGVANQLVSNVAPRLAAPLALMTPGSLNADEQEQLARYRNMAPTIDRAVPPSSRR